MARTGYHIGQNTTYIKIFISTTISGVSNIDKHRFRRRTPGSGDYVTKCIIIGSFSFQESPGVPGRPPFDYKTVTEIFREFTDRRGPGRRLEGEMSLGVLEKRPEKPRFQGEKPIMSSKIGAGENFLKKMLQN